jgi:hypothetical protein
MDGHAMVFSGRSDCVFFCLLFFSAQRSFLPTPLWRLCFSLHNHARRRLEGGFFIIVNRHDSLLRRIAILVNL